MFDVFIDNSQTVGRIRYKSNRALLIDYTMNCVLYQSMRESVFLTASCGSGDMVSTLWEIIALICHFRESDTN